MCLLLVAFFFIFHSFVHLFIPMCDMYVDIAYITKLAPSHMPIELHWIISRCCCCDFFHQFFFLFLFYFFIFIVFYVTFAYVQLGTYIRSVLFTANRIPKRREEENVEEIVLFYSECEICQNCSELFHEFVSLR